jgi:hypothetical protein
MATVLAILLLGLLPQERPPHAGDIDARIERLGHEDARTRNLAAAWIEALFQDLAAAIDLLASAPKPAHEDVRRRQERVRQDWHSTLSRFVPRAAGAPDRRIDIDSENRKVRQRLLTARVTIDLTNAPLTAVAELLHEETGLNIHVSELAASDDEVLTVRATKETPASILRRILPPRRLAYLVTDGVVQILPVRLLCKRVKLELYEVQDLVMEKEGEELIERIVKEVRPDQWMQDDGRSIQFQNGLLIVRNTLPVHRALQAFLNRQRSSAPEELRPRLPDRIVAMLRELEGPEAVQAEARLKALGRDAAYALDALSAAGVSKDLEVRLRAEALTQVLTLALGDEPCRQFLEIDGLRGLVREIRAMWTRDTDSDDFEAEARTMLGPRATSVRLITTAKLGDAPFSSPVLELLGSGGALILSGQGEPRTYTREQRLDPQEGTLVFALPRDPDDRTGDERPTFVVVELSR